MTAGAVGTPSFEDPARVLIVSSVTYRSPAISALRPAGEAAEDLVRR
jgi:hypothetical protein